mmetsp:Transcript_65463/g.114111  ORF Transcript_65463/g.114111 Transcript_65463/m.114111 type:complete len:314 (-) Transcript_65463:1373-2314(-)
MVSHLCAIAQIAVNRTLRDMAHVATPNLTLLRNLSIALSFVIARPTITGRAFNKFRASLVERRAIDGHLRDCGHHIMSVYRPWPIRIESLAWHWWRTKLQICFAALLNRLPAFSRHPLCRSSRGIIQWPLLVKFSSQAECLWTVWIELIMAAHIHVFCAIPFVHPASLGVDHSANLVVVIRNGSPHCHLHKCRAVYTRVIPQDKVPFQLLRIVPPYVHTVHFANVRNDCLDIDERVVLHALDLGQLPERELHSRNLLIAFSEFDGGVIVKGDDVASTVEARICHLDTTAREIIHLHWSDHLEPFVHGTAKECR